MLLSWLVPPPSYPQRHHPRLPGYDYHTPGSYFVTICTQDRLRLFGSVAGGRMSLSPAGAMVRDVWDEVVAGHLGVSIDTLEVMPDHLHGIIVLEDDQQRTLSLSDVLHRYKSLTTKRYARGVHDQSWPRFVGRLWQESFYDRVIRREEELDAVRRYIVENPMRWELRRAGGE